MRNRRNYYRILHVQQDAPTALIKSCYRALMLELDVHPDRGGDHWNAAVLNEAYAVLADPQRRAAYDRTLETLHARDPAPGPPAPDVEPAAPTRGRAQAASGASFCVFCGLPHGEFDERCTRCTSPLTIEHNWSDSRSGRRAVLRQALNRRIVLVDKWPHGAPCGGRIRDLSPGGLRLELDRPVAADTIVRVDSELLQATARIAYCREKGRGISPRFEIGLEFFTLRLLRSKDVFVSVSC